MTNQSAIFTVLALLMVHSINAQSLVSSLTETYLTKFFNASIETIGALANDFKFINIPRDNIKFLEYKPKIEDPVELSNDNLTDHYTNNTPNGNIKIIIHGWSDNGRLPWIRSMAQELYKKDPTCSVLAVDWHKTANKSYVYASTAVQSVGRISAEYLWHSIIKRDKNRLKRVHLLGHSLGAHVSGFLGKEISLLSGGLKIGRISALDAAAPLFTVPILRPRTLRISKEDADFVDAYHTSIYLEGQADPCGDVDVYWNCGGPIQPGCERRGRDMLLESASCSHQAVHKYFMNTIKDSSIYPVTMCNNFFNKDDGTVVLSGYSVDRKNSGRYCGSTESNKGQKCIIVYYDLSA